MPSNTKPRPRHAAAGESRKDRSADKRAVDGPRRSEMLRQLASGEPGKGLIWVPAGMENPAKVEIGVRYRDDTARHSFHAKHRGVESHYRLDDRELTINVHADREHLDPAGYDKIVTFSPCEKGSELNRGSTMVMSNALTDQHPERFRQRTREGDLIGVGDSGGYQLKNGGEPVDGLEVIRWMNTACDIGFVLDVGPRHEHDDDKPEVLKALAQAQRENCRIMMAEKADSLHLLNVAHGSTLEDAQRWIDKVRCDGFVGWGTPVPRGGSPRTGLVLIKEYKAKWVHFLGCSAPLLLPLFAWLGRYIRITCDSATYLRGMSQREYLWLNPRGRLVRPFRFGKVLKVPGRRLGIPLTCPCPVCHTLKYGDIFRQKGQVPGILLNLHNQYVLSRHVNTLSRLALRRTMTADKYREEVVAFYGERALALFDYIVIAMNDGLRDAERAARGWSGEKSYANLFPMPTDACHKTFASAGSAKARHVPCEYTNLHLLPRYLDLQDPRVRGELPRSAGEWLTTAGLMPPEGCPAT